jgi:anti-sigma factor ChrR (cupin superfamily)
MNIFAPGEEHEPSVWATLFALGELSLEDRASFERHLDAGCPECQSQLCALGGVMARLAVDVSWPPPLDRLLDHGCDEQAAIKTGEHGVLLRKAGLLITRSEVLPWETAAIPGVLSKSLFVDTERKYSTSLVRMEPRTIYPSHRHNDIEEVFVLEGELTIEGVHMVAGDFCRSEPGSIHGATSTESGALLLVFASQQDESLSDH